MENVSNTQPQASFSGWLTTGMKVYITIPLGNLQPAAAYDRILEYSQTLLSKGLLLTEPGLEAGEQAYSITHIVRSTQPSKDGIKPPAPIIYFYHDNLKWADLKTWLNTPDDIAEFERWSGVKLASMKAFPSGARLELGRNPAEDTEFVTALTPARRVIWKHNPDYTDGSKTEAKREFVRFDTPPAPAQSNTSAVISSAAQEKASEQAGAQNGANSPSSAIPQTVDGIVTDLFGEDHSDIVPEWNAIKDQKLNAGAETWGAFRKIVFQLKLVTNEFNYDGALKKYLMPYDKHTLEEAVHIMKHRKEDKPQYGGNTTKISTDELTESFEHAKAANQ